MVPAFGFSVGDFVAAIGLIAKVSKAVRDKAGASNDYQHVLLELQALERTLRHLQALRPTESNTDHVNAIRSMALTCRIPLQEFLDKIQKFETSLGPFAMHSRGCLKSAGRKSQWAVFMSDEVAKFRTVIGGKVLSTHLLLAVHTSESLSRVEAEAHKSHVASLAGILEQRTSMERLDEKIDRAQSSMRQEMQTQSEKTEKIANHMDNATERLSHISSTTDEVNTTVMSFRTLAIQLLQVIQQFPSQVRDALEQVVRSNVEMYTLLKTIHSSVLRTPAFQPEDSLRFEDVLGRTKSLPYEYFRHIEVFDSWLQIQFRGLPGEQRVLRRQYVILDAKANDDPISQAEWQSVVFPGASLVMSALIERLGTQTSTNQCPRIDCGGLGVFRKRPTFKTCDKCGMQFAVDQTSSPLSRSNLDQLSEPPNAKTQHARGRQPQKDNLQESGFRENNSGPSEQTIRELKAFRRVHVPFQRYIDATDYTVGWICALTTEMAAAVASLDELHDPPVRPPHDENSYRFGRIGQHNVVLACLPAGMTGTTSAATAAAQVRSTFPSIQFGLAGGIAGGAPSTQSDIRLGDIVVNRPSGNSKQA